MEAAYLDIDGKILEMTDLAAREEAEKLKNDIKEVNDRIDDFFDAETNHINDIVTTTERTLQNSYAGGINIVEIAGKHEQEGTPSVDDPKEIKSVKLSGIKTTKKNLLSFDEFANLPRYSNNEGTGSINGETLRVISYNEQNSGAYIKDFLQSVPEGETVTISMDVTQGNSNYGVIVGTPVIQSGVIDGTTRPKITSISDISYGMSSDSVYSGYFSTSKCHNVANITYPAEGGYPSFTINVDEHDINTYTHVEFDITPAHDGMKFRVEAYDAAGTRAKLRDHTPVSGVQRQSFKFELNKNMDGSTISNVTKFVIFLDAEVTLEGKQAFTIHSITFSGSDVRDVMYGTGVDYESIYIQTTNKTRISITTVVKRDMCFVIGNRIDRSNYYLIENIQVEYGDTATEYEPYQESYVEFSEPIELNGTDDVKDLLVKQDGVFGVLREYRYFVIDGSQGTINNNGDPGASWFELRKLYEEDIYPSGKASVPADISCNMLKTVSHDYFIANIEVTSVNDIICGFGSNSYCIRWFATKFKNFSSSQMKKYLAENPIKGVYRRRKPVFEPLPTADQIALNSLLAFGGVTNILFYSELNPTSLVEYGISKVGALLLENNNLIDKLQVMKSNVEKNNIASISQNGTELTPDGYGNVNVTVPTKVSELSNDKGYLASSDKGAANGVAELDSSGKVLSSQLPSYVDDVLEYNSKSDFPATGESGKIYIDKQENKSYRWSGSTYVNIGQSLALGETSSTAFRGDHGKTAYEHSQAEHAPSDAEKNVIVGVMQNGVELKPDSDRKINFPMPTMYTKTSQLINDSGFLTSDIFSWDETTGTLNITV